MPFLLFPDQITWTEISPPRDCVTHGNSQITKTLSDTKRVTRHCVTTTSRQGHNKVVTKRTTTTITRTQRALIKMEPIEDSLQVGAEMALDDGTNNADSVRAVTGSEKTPSEDDAVSKVHNDLLTSSADIINKLPPKSHYQRNKPFCTR
ncbi:hypothetical protein ACOMHN_037101 [Nucella lapillus]